MTMTESTSGIRSTAMNTVSDRPGEAGRPPSPTPPAGRRDLRARGNNQVYQAAGDQHIHHRPAPAPGPAKNTLPRDTPAFTGRTAELRAIVDAVTERTGPAEVIAIHAVEGMPGVGKTALAVHAGHLLERRFPDGQFFVDLHAHTAGRAAVQPADALFTLLSAAGMDVWRIPPGLDERAARWRGLMAGRKALLILDNADGYWQVEPLLPGAPGCLVLITSRRRLTGLSARHGAVTLRLDVLPPPEATALFTRLAGRDAAEAEARAVAHLARLCGYLPLAIALLAARLPAEPQWRVADLVTDLAQAQDRLALMCAENLAVAAAFDLSYRDLPAARQRLLCRLSRHPGNDFDAYAAAALDGIPVAAARRHLDALYHDHLLDQPVRGRYRMPDLIGQYTRNQGCAGPPGAHDRAVTRLLDYYRHAATVADQHVARCRRTESTPPTGPPVELPPLPHRRQALAWLRAEQANLLACAGYAIAHDRHAHLVGLAAATAAFLRRTGPWSQAGRLHEAAATAAGHTGDRPGQAGALADLGAVRLLTGDYPAAGRALRQALDIYRQLGDCHGQADILHQLGRLGWQTEDYRGATETLQRSLAMHRELGERLGTADCLNDLGIVRYLTDDYPGAVDALEQALAIFADLADRLGQADTLNQLGVVRRLTADYPRAAQALEQAFTLFGELGHRHGQADSLHQLGGVRWRIGDYPGAVHALGQALAIFADLGDRHGQANVLNDLGIVRYLTDDYPGAADTLEQAMSRYRELGYRLGQADTLNQLGVVHRLTGDLPAAARAHEQALVAVRELGDRLGQAEVHNNLGMLLLARGKPARALAQHRLALRLAREVHSPLEEARACHGAGRCARRLGDTGDAAEHLRRALDVYRRIGVPQAQQAAVELEELTPCPAARRSRER